MEEENPSSSSTNIKLIIEKGPKEGESIEYKSTKLIKIGRVVRGNTFQIKESGISSNHISIHFDFNKWMLTDLDSSNGTFLNGEKLEPGVPTPLNDADCIKIGELTSIVVKIGMKSQLQYCIMYGGGAVEISCSIAVDAATDKSPGVEQYAITPFADALDAVPMALAENSGLSPIETLSAVKAKHRAHYRRPRKIVPRKGHKMIEVPKPEVVLFMKKDETFRCNETGYRIPVKCVKDRLLKLNIETKSQLEEPFLTAYAASFAMPIRA
ncbi:SMAD/FHA domain-containing protein [Artemisia annua]|uniref:SMAD/FHA domain-containing protein n=1 Tax=Artemisia annua TaxID=35608 RepID=A0A2U1LZV5_ARTAN|nr:SMAD/FHA domain-containing protein [Artemisia annua]